MNHPIQLERLLERLDSVKISGPGYTARCPAHDDRHNSLSVGIGAEGKVLIKCHAGCEVAAVLQTLGMTFNDLFPGQNGKLRGSARGRDQEGEGVSNPSDTPATVQHPGLTLDQYAAAKHLDPSRLRSFGLTDVSYQRSPAVRIPYHDEAGNEVAVRFRLRLDKSDDVDDRFRWKTGAKPCLYGQDRLAQARERGYVVLVEGESDCHTLWHHNEPALGIPGASNWNEGRDAPLLNDIPIIYVVIEPDQGGASLLKTLRVSSIRDRVCVIRLGGFKDPSALHCDDPTCFPERWATAVAAAVPLSDILKAEATAEADAAWESCQDLALEPDILARAAETVAALGVTGERAAVQIVYLAMVSRLLPRPVNVVVKGPSSGGKSFMVEQTLRLFPNDSYYALTAMSERALAYSEEPLSHRMMVMYEAAGLTGEMASYLLRSLLSEGRIQYETVEKTSEGLQARLIVREGPTGLIVTTTAANLHPENETRLLSLAVTDTQDQTRAVFHALANGGGPEPDLQQWHALQRWLEVGERQVEIPFALALADLVPPKAVRMRRDFGLLLTLIRAHALLHRASREIGPDGSIIATLDDYEVVRALVDPLIAAGVEATVPPTIRETVDAVQSLCPGTGDTASLTTIASALRLDKSATSRRVHVARERGFLVNHETRKGKPAKIGIGEPLPLDAPVLPDRCSVAAFLARATTPPPSPAGPESARQVFVL